MVRVLQIAYGFEGGVGRVINEYYSHMNSEEVVFDVVAWESDDTVIQDHAKKLGIRFFYIERNDEWIKNYNKIKSIIDENYYDIIHFHGVFDWHLLRYAKKKGIKKRIVHSHCAFGKVEPSKKSTLKCLAQDYLLRLYATDLWGCGKEAIEFQWKKPIFNNTYVMRNAVDLKEFAFNSEKRDKLRVELGLQNRFVIGCIARLSFQKNHDYLISVFDEVAKLDSRAVLVLVGSGELKDKVESQIQKLELQDRVFLLGERDDVKDLLNIFDVFVLTSRWEGLPVSIIEAQANGLNCVISNKITSECNILPGMRSLALEDDIKEWVSAILSTKRCGVEETRMCMQASGFDIEIAAKEVEAIYLQNRS